MKNLSIKEMKQEQKLLARLADIKSLIHAYISSIYYDENNKEYAKLVKIEHRLCHELALLTE